MHDPLCVAFEVSVPGWRRPWDPHGPRWRMPRKMRPAPGTPAEEEQLRTGRPTFPWWKLSSWMGGGPVVAGWQLHAHTLVRVWHREPDDEDAGDVCQHYRTNRAGERVRSGRWRWHAHHWKIQIPALQTLRRRLLTRCAWCGGRHRRGDPTTISHQRNRERTPWWRGETGLYHHDCSSIAAAHRACLCEAPILASDGWGLCARCLNYRAFRQTPAILARQRLLATIPPGQRDASKYQQVCDDFAAEQAARARIEAEQRIANSILRPFGSNT